MRLDDRDRRRLVWASALTVAALPAVWLVNRDETTTRPSVAAVGLAPGEVAASTTTETIDPMGPVSPGFLGAAATPRPAAQPPAPVVGTGAGVTLATGTAIFRRSVTDSRTCLFSGVPSGSYVTVVNVANNRSTDCWTALRAPDQPQGELVMSAGAFASIADPTTAPIHVEIRSTS